LLQKLEARGFDVFGSRPARLSKSHKLLLVLRMWCRVVSGEAAPSYGTPPDR
jgi:hypothetical protein